MPNEPNVSHVDPVVRRSYEPPKLTVLGNVAQLTQDPQSRPRAASELGAASIVFLGDDA